MKETIDKYQFKITIAVAISIIIFLIMLSASFATWKNEMQNQQKAMTLRQDQLSDGHELLKTDVVILERRLDDNDLTLVEIRTKLVNIESLLVDIKQDIKDK